MIKADGANLTFMGDATTLVVEACGVIRHLLRALAKQDKRAAIAAFATITDVLSEISLELEKKYGIKAGTKLKVEEEPDDDDLIREFLDSLSQKELKTLLDIVNKFGSICEEEDDD